MTIQVMLRSADYRGDHATDTLVAIEPIPGETVEHLVDRTIGRAWLEAESEVVELRVARPAPRRKGGDAPCGA